MQLRLTDVEIDTYKWAVTMRKSNTRINELLDGAMCGGWKRGEETVIKVL